KGQCLGAASPKRLKTLRQLRMSMSRSLNCSGEFSVTSSPKQSRTLWNATPPRFRFGLGLRRLRAKRQLAGWDQWTSMTTLDDCELRLRGLFDSKRVCQREFWLYPPADHGLTDLHSHLRNHADLHHATLDSRSQSDLPALNGRWRAHSDGIHA